MRTFFYILSGALIILIVIVFFANLGPASIANVQLLGADPKIVKSGTIVFFSSILGAITAIFAFYGIYFKEVFGKKETVWSGNQKENISKKKSEDNWENTEW